MELVLCFLEVLNNSQSLKYLTIKFKASKIAKNRPGNPSTNPLLSKYLLRKRVNGLKSKNLTVLVTFILTPSSRRYFASMLV